MNQSPPDLEISKFEQIVDLSSHSIKIELYFFYLLFCSFNFRLTV